MKLKFDSYNRKESEKHVQKSKQFGKTVRNLAFTVALPLLSVISGCTIYKYDKPPECRKFNDTTTSINRETDGRVARITELEKYPGDSTMLTPELIEGDALISEEVIDFINETHALSTGGLPPDTTITKVPLYCFDSNQYAISDIGGFFVYYPQNISSVSAFAFHEIGHLQPGGEGNELIAELNELDQNLAAFAVFANQEYPEDIIRFVRHANCSCPLYLYFSLLEGIPGDISSFDQYHKADIFIHNKLIENDGDLSAVRAEAVELANNGNLSDALDEELLKFLDRYSSHPNPATDVSVIIKMMAVKWLNMRFGPEMAQAYFDSNVYNFFPDCQAPRFVFGLDGMNCTEMSMDMQNTDIPTPAECSTLGGEIQQEVTARFCCFSMEITGGEMSFEKSVVDASGYTCSGSLQINDMEWFDAYFLNVDSRTELGIDEPCH